MRDCRTGIEHIATMGVVVHAVHVLCRQTLVAQRALRWGGQSQDTPAMITGDSVWPLHADLAELQFGALRMRTHGPEAARPRITVHHSEVPARNPFVDREGKNLGGRVVVVAPASHLHAVPPVIVIYI
jgi:hypothetical protein